MKLITFSSTAGTARVGELRDDGTVAELAAPSMIHWLAGEGRAATGTEHALADVRVLAPVPDPPSVRDFYAYEGHVAAGFRRRRAGIPRYWFQAPAFYFSNPAAIAGPGELIARPDDSTMLDFELEIAAIIDGAGAIAGFALLNDWSARDIQAHERTVGLGPAKAKDFATSLGPWLVTPDELPFDGEWLDLEATVSVNGRLITRARSEPMYFSWRSLVAHAARNTRLRPGDILGSGTLTGGCLLELGPIDGHWIEPGDEVTLAAPGLGELRTPVGEHR
jgi:fumarylacetoacetate (FAA) hydrolase